MEYSILDKRLQSMTRTGYLCTGAEFDVIISSVPCAKTPESVGLEVIRKGNRIVDQRVRSCKRLRRSHAENSLPYYNNHSNNKLAKERITNRDRRRNFR